MYDYDRSQGHAYILLGWVEMVEINNQKRRESIRHNKGPTLIIVDGGFEPRNVRLTFSGTLRFQGSRDFLSFL
jgi:hypothetical protein